MGVLTEMLKNEKPIARKISNPKITRMAQQKIPAGPSEPCSVCGGREFWMGAYTATWYCKVCSPPKFEAFVKSRHVVPSRVAQTDSGYEFIEKLQTWFGPAEHFDGYAHRWRSFYRMTDGVSGVVQEGNEHEGMATIDAFN